MMSRKNRKLKPAQEQAPTQKVRPNVSIVAKNVKQQEYLHDLNHIACVIGEGSAGTGKTFLAASVAAQKLTNREIARIVLTRANVGTGKSLGAFPGTLEEKMAPWLLPITDVLELQLGTGFYKYALKAGIIQFQAIETIRGRSFPDAFILVDEAQQLEVPELKAIVTRLGENSTVVLMGDTTQRDIHNNGLEWLINLAERHHLPVAHHSFTSDDIVRSDLCALFVKAFEAEQL